MRMAGRGSWVANVRLRPAGEREQAARADLVEHLAGDTSASPAKKWGGTWRASPSRSWALARGGWPSGADEWPAGRPEPLRFPPSRSPPPRTPSSASDVLPATDLGAFASPARH